MIDLHTYLNNVNSCMILTTEQKKKLLCLDKLFWEIAQLYHKDKYRYVTNFKTEYDKFITCYKNKIKYFPKLEFENDIKYDSDGVLDKIDQLIYEFRNFNCFLSKYYLEILMAYKQMIRGCIDPKKII